MRRGENEEARIWGTAGSDNKRIMSRVDEWVCVCVREKLTRRGRKRDREGYPVHDSKLL